MKTNAKLPRKGYCTVMAYPKFENMMCGTVDIRQFHDGRVELTYEDGTRESAVLDYALTADTSIFKVVGDVQSIARKVPI